jgi:dienelactone hydrolase
MAEVLLFHHALGLTPGVLAFAEELRSGGHCVHVPDLYDGKTFGTVPDGVAFAEEIGFTTVLDRGRAAAEDLPSELVYAGFSLGVMPAQLLAQTRPGARGALLFNATVPIEEFGSWPAGLPGQIHTMDGDDLGDVEIAVEAAASVPELELFLYPGSAHLFADSSLDDYDEAAAAQLMQRVRKFLSRVDTAI